MIAKNTVQMLNIIKQMLEVDDKIKDIWNLTAPWTKKSFSFFT